MIMTNVNKVKHPLGMHNTYWPVATVDASNTDRAKESIVHPFMVPLIEALQVKRPHWEFEASSMGTRGVGEYSQNVLHSTFDIYDNGEKLGTIYREYRGDSNVYAAKSHRISAKRQIGNGKMSKHLKVIVSEVLREMYPRTVTEIADEKYKTSYQTMKEATYKDRRVFMQTADKVSGAMLAYLTTGDRWREFEAVEDTPEIMKAKASLKSQAESARIATDTAASAHVVLIERPRDIIVKGSNGLSHTSSLELLPDGVKTKLALLKMGETGTIIPEVGIRTGDDTFYILTEAP
jgi:hypothetical protein